MRILPAKDHAEAFLMVETGRADAFLKAGSSLRSMMP
jgi:glutamate/aspartate transport system substrate-binding protein